MRERYLQNALYFAATPRERATLVQLMEEASELIQAASKVLRWGFESWNPDEPERITNDERLASEFRDVVNAYDRMRAAQARKRYRLPAVTP